VMSYNGPVNDHLPGLPDETKLTPPKLWKIPMVWFSAEEVVRCFPLMASLHQISTSAEDFKQLQEKYDHLPWEWIANYSYDELKQFHILLPKSDKKKDF